MGIVAGLLGLCILAIFSRALILYIIKRNKLKAEQNEHKKVVKKEDLKTAATLSSSKVKFDKQQTSISKEEKESKEITIDIGSNLLKSHDEHREEGGFSERRGLVESSEHPCSPDITKESHKKDDLESAILDHSDDHEDNEEYMKYAKQLAEGVDLIKFMDDDENEETQKQRETKETSQNTFRGKTRRSVDEEWKIKEVSETQENESIAGPWRKIYHKVYTYDGNPKGKLEKSVSCREKFEEDDITQRTNHNSITNNSCYYRSETEPEKRDKNPFDDDYFESQMKMLTFCKMGNEEKSGYAGEIANQEGTDDEIKLKSTRRCLTDTPNTSTDF